MIYLAVTDPHIRFVSMVADATGAWEPSGGQVLVQVSRAAAAQGQIDVALLSESLGPPPAALCFHPRQLWRAEEVVLGRRG